MQGHIDQGELVVSQKERNATRAAPTGPEVENPAPKDSGNKRRCTTQQQEGPPKKTVRRQSHQHALKEISSDQIGGQQYISAVAVMVCATWHYTGAYELS